MSTAATEAAQATALLLIARFISYQLSIRQVEDFGTCIESKGQGKGLRFKIELYIRLYIKKGAKETNKAKRSEAGQKGAKPNTKAYPSKPQRPRPRWPCRGCAVRGSFPRVWACARAAADGNGCVSSSLPRPKPSRPTSFTHASKSPPNPNGRGDSGRRVVGVRCAALFLVRPRVRPLLPIAVVEFSRAYLGRSRAARPPCCSSQKAH